MPPTYYVCECHRAADWFFSDGKGLCGFNAAICNRHLTTHLAKYMSELGITTLTGITIYKDPNTAWSEHAPQASPEAQEPKEQ